jgi:hypothetical protein
VACFFQGQGDGNCRDPIHLLEPLPRLCYNSDVRQSYAMLNLAGERRGALGAQVTEVKDERGG